MATNYSRGRAFEYRVRDLMKERGALLVVRAAGSHTPADLVAIFPWEVALIQCKRDGKLPKGEQESLVAIARAAPAQNIVCYHAKAGPNGRGIDLQRLTKETQSGK